MRRVGMFVLLVVVAVAWFAFVEPNAGPASTGQTTSSSAAPAPSEAPPAPSAQPGSGSSAERSLPPEARDTIAAIDRGGPFRYDRDGVVFQNREGRLPSQPRGYWREYTVPTPGSDDRGARRLVEGRSGELYYTDDHYNSFRRIRSAGAGS